MIFGDMVNLMCDRGTNGHFSVTKVCFARIFRMKKAGLPGDLLMSRELPAFIIIRQRGDERGA
ncbi:hypothetical protein [Mobilibacterium timonense]|uniref:hypothetical protein n=1 Tax=Mobilibacterium timonense TaxID=1871012 RepID=UPI0009869396|nr:hypothetical protein [Mobilibacterium timonense]MBM6990560.1 hypothetical protein [Mobilibacterium timonense]